MEEILLTISIHEHPVEDFPGDRRGHAAAAAAVFHHDGEGVGRSGFVQEAHEPGVGKLLPVDFGGAGLAADLRAADLRAGARAARDDGAHVILQNRGLVGSQGLAVHLGGELRPLGAVGGGGGDQQFSAGNDSGFSSPG